MECNRCFKSCPEGTGAYVCGECYLLVCKECKNHFEGKEGKGDGDDDREESDAEGEEARIDDGKEFDEIKDVIDNDEEDVDAMRE